MGGGASLRLSDRLRFNAAVRDYIMTPAAELTDVGSTDDLTHNTLITAGLTLSIGGSSAPSERELVERGIRAERERQRARESERERERDRYRELDTERRGDRRDRVYADSGGRWMTIPVPTVGEVILRFGMTASGTPSSTTTTTGLTIEELRRVLRDELQRDPASGRVDTVTIRRDPDPTTTDDATAARLADMERRLTARLDAIEAGRSADTTARPAPVVSDDSTGETRITAVPVFGRLGRVTSRDLRPFIGIGGGDGTQALLSLRADRRPVTQGSGFRFGPEVALGFGSRSPSLLALASIQDPCATFGGSTAIRPYVTVGAGIQSPSILAGNTAVGTSCNLPGDSASPLYTHVELQGLNLFDYTRLMFGISTRAAGGRSGARAGVGARSHAASSGVSCGVASDEAVLRSF